MRNFWKFFRYLPDEMKNMITANVDNAIAKNLTFKQFKKNIQDIFYLARTINEKLRAGISGGKKKGITRKMA